MDLLIQYWPNIAGGLLLGYVLGLLPRSVQLAGFLLLALFVYNSLGGTK